ncbi:MAG: hypothetical protein N3A02_01375, partial [Rectinema sp.]|nr:hypothetical protein [Rectinema sp.]
GGSIHALTGIKASGMLFDSKNIRVLRPLLDIERSQITQYAEIKQLSWSEDSSNRDMGFMRNRIRHELIPLLERNFPSWRRALHSYLHEFRYAVELIRSIGEERSTEMIRVASGQMELDLLKFSVLHPAIRIEIMKRFLAIAGMPSQKAGKAGVQLLGYLNKRGQSWEAGGYAFEVHDGFLRCVGKAEGSSNLEWRRFHVESTMREAESKFVLVASEGTYVLKSCSFEITTSEADAPGVEKERKSVRLNLDFPFILRDRRPGDSIFIDGKQIQIEKYLRKMSMSHSSRSQILIAEDLDGISAILGVNEELEEIEIFVQRFRGSCPKKEKFVMLSLKGVLPKHV